MNKNIKKTAGRVLRFTLVSLLALSAPESAYASAVSTQKDETVYVNLDASGKVMQTTVSDWLHADGSVQRIEDRSDLKNIQNVKSNEKPAREGNSLTWMLNPGASDAGKDIYYEGTTDKTLPLSVSVSYTLDGKEVTANEIAGKTGKVAVKISVRNTDSHTVAVGGKNVEMTTPMTAVVAVVLPSGTFRNVSVSSGTLFSDGNNQFAAFLTVPGLSESIGLKDCGISELSGLDFPEDLTITADAADFTLGSIAVAATPELPDADGLKKSDNIDEMKTNLQKLKGMQDDIEKADPQKDIRSLFTNPDRTAAARILVDDVFDFYGLDTRAIDVLPQYVTNDNIKLYDRVTSDLDKADLRYLLDDKTLRGLNDRVTDKNVEQIRKLLSDYDEIKTFDMTKLSHVLKIMDGYEKNYDRLDDIFSDAKRILNRFNRDDINTLAALDSSGVQNKLDDVLKDMKSMGQYSGVIKSLNLKDDDYEYMVAALMEKRLGSGDQSTLKLIDQFLPKATDGYLPAASLLGGGGGTLPTSLTGAIKTAVQNDSIHTVVSLGDFKTILTASSGQILKAVEQKFPPELPTAMKTALSGALEKDLTADAGNVLTGMKTKGRIDSDSNVSVKNLIAAINELNRQITEAETGLKSGDSTTVGTIENNNFPNFVTTISNIKTQHPEMSDFLTGLQHTVISGIVEAIEAGTGDFDTESALQDPALLSKVRVQKASLVSCLETLVKKGAITTDQLAEIVKSELADVFQSVDALSTDAADLRSALSDKKALGSDYLSDLSGLRDNLRSQAGNLRRLQNDVKDISENDEGKMDESFDMAKDLLTDKDEMDYLIGWAHKLKSMKSDMDGGDGNIDLMRDLLKEYDDPKIKNIRSMIPTLQNDFDDARPVLESLKDQLSLPGVSESLHKLPQTTEILLKTERDVRANRAIMDIFRKTTQPETVSLFRNTFSTLDDFQAKGSIDDYLKKIDDAEDLLDRKDAYVKLSDQYGIFTKAADGADTKLKFVFKTEAVEKPEAKPAAVKTAEAPKPEDKGGFLGWVRSLWNSAADSIKNLF